MNKNQPYANGDRPFTVTLMVPVLNEIVGLKKIMPLIDRSWVDQILVVDGGSKDGSAEWSREQGYDVVVQKHRGLRFAFIEGFPSIKSQYVITFSPDGNSPPEGINRLIEKIKAERQLDMVIGSRYLPPARSEDDDLITGFGNWLFTKTVNILFGTRLTDCMVMYRIYRTSLFYDLLLDQDESYQLPERLFFTKLGVEPLLSARAAKYGCQISEVPIDEPKRIGGDRKLQVLRWGAAYYFQFWWERLTFKNREILENLNSMTDSATLPIKEIQSEN